MKFQLPIIAGDKASQSSEWIDALPQNMYAVDRPSVGSDGYLIDFPGFDITSVVNSASDFDRGGIWVSALGFDGHYRVIGENLYEIPFAPDNTILPAVLIGPVLGSGQCSLAYSFNNLAIVSGGRLYYYNQTDGLRQITGAYVGSPIDITWGDNVFILTDGVNIYHSNPLDEEDYLPLDYGTAEFRPDPSLGVAFNEDSELVAFGSNSIEHFTNIGAENFLFRRIKQKAQKIGIVGTHAKGEFGNTYYMLGGRTNSQIGVYITESGASQKISSIAIDKILASYSADDLKTSIVEVIDIDGVQLCLIHCPNEVLCFNASAAKRVGVDRSWSLLMSSDADDYMSPMPHRAYNYVRDPNRKQWLVGDKQFAAVGKMNTDSGMQYGWAQECIFYTPVTKIESLSVDSIELETVPGVGVVPLPLTSIYPADDAAVFVSLTYDGRTHGNEWTKFYGMRNVYNTRFIANRLGYVRDKIGFRFRSISSARKAYSSLTVEAS